ncbi:hypothetical protein OAP69_05300 [Hellea sp.]|nr:hypothetical protein [Hellea sp.]
MAFRLVLILVIIVSLSGTVHARPVSYPGGWTFMQKSNGSYSSIHAHYSPTASDSIGMYIERNWQEDITFTGVQYNRLVKRWNGRKSQANFYVKAGVGQAQPFGKNGDQIAGFTELAMDWETRRWFTEYRIRATDYADNQSIHHSGRLGIAPYIGNYGDLHTWLMVQVENHPESNKPTTTTPLVRLFKGVQMLELGYTIEHEEWLANWIVRF